ncbi:24-dehydrocholesterol reductase, partial [Operophtera brumata]
YILVEYRWVVVVVFLLPLSLLWKVYSTARNYVVFKLNSAPKMHDKKIKDWLSGDRSTKLCTARPTWQTMSFRQGVYKSSFTNIRVDLVDVLEVDTTNMTVRCEPLVTMGQLSRTLAPLGLALAVVPELDQLTVGGLVMGTGVETSSHEHGLFQHICQQYELVLADGSVDEIPDLYYAVPWSYGTLGFLTSVVIKVVPAKKYVRVQYHPYNSLDELVKRFSEEALKKNPHQFVEALLYTQETGVVMTADMVDEVGRDGKDIIRFGNNPIFRILLGWLMPPEVSLLKLTQPAAVAKLYEKAHVIQDMLVPVQHLKEAVELFHHEFEVYPVWLCPFKVFDNPGQLKTSSGDAEIREEFREMFDHTLYDRVRDSLPYCKQAFPEIYGKVNKSARK